MLYLEKGTEMATDQINWYPGHMKKTRELITENIKVVDLVVEILDARIPRSSRNPILHEITGKKEKLVLLNKSDLADGKENDRWVEHLRRVEGDALLVNANRGDGIKALLKGLEGRKKRRKGKRTDLPYRLMVVGVPNVGKSSFINRMTGKKSTQTGDKPGVTKGKQWLTIPGEMQLLDTPGILWPKFEDPLVGKKLAFCGSIRDEILDLETLALDLVAYLQGDYPELLKKRYKLEALEDTPLGTMEAIGTKRGFLKRGGLVDYQRTARTLLDEFRGGNIGRITLEKVEG